MTFATRLTETEQASNWSLVAGIVCLVLGLADTVVVHATGIDPGDDAIFWCRFTALGLGLVLISYCMYLSAPRGWRIAITLLAGAAIPIALTQPGYYIFFQGPLANDPRQPLDILRGQSLSWPPAHKRAIRALALTRDSLRPAVADRFAENPGSVPVITSLSKPRHPGIPG